MRVDLHCDALSKNLNGSIRLPQPGGVLQCFAAFCPTDEAAAYAAASALYKDLIKSGITPVICAREGLLALKRGEPCAALTCENIGFSGGRKEGIRALKKDGVIMASLVWNNPNALAYPNLRADGKFERRGLKPKGREALELLQTYKIIPDISHLSDGGTVEVLRGRKTPAVASHSNCRAVCKNMRNLTDTQLKMLADCGGAAGINFYAPFLGGEGGFAAVAAHIKHMIRVAGEDTPCFGSDWDGAPADKIGVCPQDMPKLLRFLLKEGITPRMLEKICYKNFFRVLKETAGK